MTAQLRTSLHDRSPAMPPTLVMRSVPARAVALAAFAVALGGCAASPRGATPATGSTAASAPAPAAAASASASAAASATASATATADGWRPLITGNSLAGWRGYKADTVPAGWTVADGMLTKSVGTRDLVTQEQFGDFELEWEWKLATGGNAGVFYRGTEEYDRIYWTGTEYQLLDDPNAPDGRSRLTSAGAVYGLYPSPEGVVKPAGEWNASRVVARGAHVEHWLNGQKLAEYEAGSPDWEAKVKASKFARWPNYGRARRGHIAIQGDHRGDLAIRGMRIRELR